MISRNPGSYRFRQRPGTSNALGLVKFHVPNRSTYTCTTRLPITVRTRSRSLATAHAF